MTWPASNLYKHLIASAKSVAQPFHATWKDHAALLDDEEPVGAVSRMAHKYRARESGHDRDELNRREEWD